MTDVHENYSAGWGTPEPWLKWAADTMGGIDLDPCGDPQHPTPHCKTTLSTDGTERVWRGKVYTNPPGANSIVSVKPWWEHAADCIGIGTVDAMVWCFFNCEATRHLEPSPWSMQGHMVLPSKRVAFLRGGVPIKQPRNWAWFWVYNTDYVAEPPVECRIVRTG
jgi:hypothetical protein